MPKKRKTLKDTKQTPQEVFIGHTLGIPEFRAFTNRDTDKDGVPDYRDCQPFDPTLHGIRWEKFKKAVKKEAKKVKRGVSEIVEERKQAKRIEERIKRLHRSALLRAIAKVERGLPLTQEEAEAYGQYILEKEKKEAQKEKLRQVGRRVREYVEEYELPEPLPQQRVKVVRPVVSRPTYTSMEEYNKIVRSACGFSSPTTKKKKGSQK